MSQWGQSLLVVAFDFFLQTEDFTRNFEKGPDRVGSVGIGAILADF